MAATVHIQRLTGAGPSSTNIESANTRLKQADDGAADANNPIPVPTSSTNYSYWAVTRLNAATTPANSISNLKWYSDGSSWGTGLTANAGTASAYAQATSAVQLNLSNYGNAWASIASDVSTLTSSSPASLSGSLSNPSTGSFGPYLSFQLGVGTTAVAGNVTQRTLTWQYDES